MWLWVSNLKIKFITSDDTLGGYEELSCIML